MVNYVSSDSANAHCPLHTPFDASHAIADKERAHSLITRLGLQILLWMRCSWAKCAPYPAEMHFHLRSHFRRWTDERGNARLYGGHAPLAHSVLKSSAHYYIHKMYAKPSELIFYRSHTAYLLSFCAPKMPNAKHKLDFQRC